MKFCKTGRGATIEMGEKEVKEKADEAKWEEERKFNCDNKGLHDSIKEKRE